MTSARRLKLTPSFQRYYDPGRVDGYRMRIVVSDAHLVSSKVFRYREIPLQPGAAERQGVFDGVCSPADLEEFPEDAPLPNADPPWYRSDTVDLVFRSQTLADAAWLAIQGELTQLLLSLDFMDDLEPGTAIWIGTEPDEDSSSSSLGD